MTPDPIAAATAAIVAVQARHPTLTVFGFRPRGCETLAAERAEMLTAEAAEPPEAFNPHVTCGSSVPLRFFTARPWRRF
jgi:hypothetical protein